MNGTPVDIRTPEGIADCHLFHPEGDGALPAVIMYMDAGGIRSEMCQMAGRLASNGYTVLLPNLYYRSEPVAPFDAATVFSNDAEWQRLMGLVQTLSNELRMRDTAAFLDYLGS